MRASFVALLALVVAPAAAQAQSFNPSFSVQAAAGPTVVNSGHTVAAAIGFSPWSRVTFLVEVQRTELSSRVTPSAFNNRSPYIEFRGGTITAVSGEVRVALFPPDRITPYVLAGFGGGESRPTVNQHFPEAVRNDVGFVFFGGGVQVPVRNHLSVFGDFRVIGGPEGYDSMIVMYPVRIGMAWRF